MLIDWFTIIAQVLNFLILVWLLRRFLYKPILKAIDAREKKIEAELSDASAREAEAKKEQAEFKRKNKEFDQQRSALLDKTKEEVNAERQRLLEEVRKETSDLRLKQQEALKKDKQDLNQEIRRRAQQEVFYIAQKALTDLAGASLEERIVEVFVQKLRELKGEEKKQFASALSASPGSVSVRTAFDLPQADRDLIKKTVKETLGIDIQARFETVPDLIGGIELTTNGQKVAWSIADYLTSLEKGIDELLKEQPKSEVKTKPEPDELKSKTESETKTVPVSTSNEPKEKQESETESEPSKQGEPEPK